MAQLIGVFLLVSNLVFMSSAFADELELVDVKKEMQERERSKDLPRKRKKTALIRRGGYGDFLKKSKIFNIDSPDLSKRYDVVPSRISYIYEHIMLGEVKYMEFRGDSAEKVFKDLNVQYLGYETQFPDQRLEENGYTVIYGRGLSCIKYIVYAGNGGQFHCAFFWDAVTKETFSADMILPRATAGGSN